MTGDRRPDTATPGGDDRPGTTPDGPFADRATAGRELAERLRDLRLERPVVAGISRSGAVVAAEVARALAAPFDMIVVRKVYGPDDVAVGAVAEHEVRVENAALVASSGLTRAELRALVAERLRELASVGAAYRRVRPAIPLTGRTVILVDGGMTTTSTATAAGKAAFARGADRTVLAVPVASIECVEAVRHQIDEVVALRTPALLLSVEEWYERYPPVTDDEVVEILGSFASNEPRPPAA